MHPNCELTTSALARPQVQRKLPWFLQSAPSMACAKGGAGAYTDAIQVDPADDTGVAGLSRGVVAASSFRTSYVPLSSQDDFISALRVCCFLDCLRVERSFCCIDVGETLHCDCIKRHSDGCTLGAHTGNPCQLLCNCDALWVSHISEHPRHMN